MKLPLKIIDAHIHFYDNQINQHEFLNSPDPTFTELVGDYSTLPRQYLPKSYLQDTAPYQIEGVVWHEYLSTDPLKEAKWANSQIDSKSLKQAMVVFVDFLDPQLESKLNFYQSLPHVTAVREHLGWDHENPLRRFSKRSDLLTDNHWLKNIKLLENYPFKCGLEIFSHQLLDLAKVIASYPNVGFTIAIMGWPLDISANGFKQWKGSLTKIANYPNVIEIFGTNRCMFGSHMPIAKLSRSFDQLYKAYEEIVIHFSDQEKEDLFHNVAERWFRL